MSELASICDGVVPFDSVVMGEHTLMEPKSYSDENLFQKSGLYSLALDNLAYPLYSGRNELHELIPKLIYSQAPNLFTVQMQVPYPFDDSDKAHFLKDMKAETLAKREYYMEYNTGLKELKRHAIRQTYTVRGLETLVSESS